MTSVGGMSPGPSGASSVSLAVVAGTAASCEVYWYHSVSESHGVLAVMVLVLFSLDVVMGEFVYDFVADDVLCDVGGVDVLFVGVGVMMFDGIG